jgi:hypothetical protein
MPTLQTTISRLQRSIIHLLGHRFSFRRVVQHYKTTFYLQNHRRTWSQAYQMILFQAQVLSICGSLPKPRLFQDVMFHPAKLPLTDATRLPLQPHAKILAGCVSGSESSCSMSLILWRLSMASLTMIMSGHRLYQPSDNLALGGRFYSGSRWLINGLNLQSSSLGSSLQVIT